MALLASLPRPALVLLAEGYDSASLPPALQTLSDGAADQVTVARLPIAPPRPGGSVRSVLLLAPDLAALRRAASVLPSTGRCRAVACVVVESQRPIPPTLRPEWPRASHLRAELVRGSAVTVVRFTAGAPGAEVLTQLARDAGAIGGNSRVAGGGGLVTALVSGSASDAWPPADQQVRVRPSVAAAAAADVDVPPSLILGAASAAEPAVEPTTHPVTGRAPVVIADLAAALAIGPLDEAVFNPRGFVRSVDAAAGEGTLAVVGERIVLRLPGDAEVGADQPSWPLVRAARSLRSVRVDGADLVDGVGGVRYAELRLARVIAALAMAGTPLSSATVSPRLADLIGPDLAALLTAHAELGDPLRREEHSIRLRRAALTRHSSVGWRQRYAGPSGLRVAGDPSVSIILATRRPALLPFALRQVARQSVDAELVLAGHGFAPDPTLVGELLGDRAVTIRSLPETAVFGSVLADAAAAASGDVLVKMDDDDWYGPDVIADLLLARRYSGADLIGMPAEFCYLEPIATTVRRRGPSEAFGRVVAGGTMMIDRTTLRRVGGFRPVTRHVDAQLLAAVRAAGGGVYRTHGLGYLLRRSAGGHTWATSLGYFLSRQSVSAQWRGFRPSRLMEWTSADLGEASG